MKKNISKVMALGVTVVTVVIAVLISVLLCANYYEQKNRKSIEDFVGTFSYGDTGRSMEDVVYLAIASTGENQNKLQFIEYKISDEEVINRGTCMYEDGNYVTLRDDEDGIVAHVVYVKDECLLLSNGQEAKTLKKISDGAVVPTNQEE